jgi:hypothetical protein
VRNVQLYHYLTTDTVMTPEEVGNFIGIPVLIVSPHEPANQFHVTIENWMHGTIDAVEEISKMAQNGVIIGDAWRAKSCHRLVMGIAQGFQMLNLKNDQLRRRVDAIKYSVDRVQEVIYDLTLRNVNMDRPDEVKAGKKVKIGENGEEAEMKD